MNDFPSYSELRVADQKANRAFQKELLHKLERTLIRQMRARLRKNGNLTHKKPIQISASIPTQRKPYGWTVSSFVTYLGLTLHEKGYPPCEITSDDSDKAECVLMLLFETPEKKA